MKFGDNPDVELLKRLKTLAEFDQQQLVKLASMIRMQTVKKREKIIEKGCNEKYYLYLLRGEVEILAGDGKSSRLQRNLTQNDITEDLTPIARIRPSLYDVIARKPSTILRIYSEHIKEISQLGSDDTTGLKPIDEEEDIDDTDFTSILLQQFQEENKITVEMFLDLNTGSIRLPSLPLIAQKIEHAYKSDRFNARQLKTLIQSDPVITAKLIMYANSSLDNSQPRIKTLGDAIDRLGPVTLRRQVMIYATNELFEEKAHGLSDQIQNQCLQSQKIASICRIIARKTGLFDPDLAYLAGLIHDLGVIAIIQYYQDNSADNIDYDILFETVEHLRSQVTREILLKWQFDDQIITAAEEYEDWFREHNTRADLCDLVIVARYHSYIGTPNLSNLPPITALPAMQKLKLDELGPLGSIDILKESKQKIQQMRQLMASI